MRVVILVRDTLSWPVLHNCEVSWLYSKQFFSYEADMKLHLKPSRGKTQKVWKRELSFLYATHRHDLFYIAVRYHQNIPNSFQVMERTQNCIWNHQGETTQKVWQWVLLLVCDTSSCHNLRNYKVSSKYSKPFSSYGAGKRLHLKPSRGNNSKCMKARIVILVCDKSSWPGVSGEGGGLEQVWIFLQSSQI